MTWLVAGVSLFATWLNIRRVRACFAIWLFTNSAWAVYDFAHGLPAQGCLMCVYAGLSVAGLVAWRKPPAGALPDRQAAPAPQPQVGGPGPEP